MDLKLDVRVNGRAAQPLVAEVERELCPADIAMLESEKGSEAPPLAKLRARHHSLARAIASGMAQGHAAIVCGYSESRVSILMSDPAFQELVAFYRRDTDEVYRDMHVMLSQLGQDAVAELHERLEEKPDEFSNSMLLDIVGKMADRTGYGPSTKTTTQVNVNVGIADRLEAARQRKRKMLQQIEDAEIIDPPLLGDG